MKAIFACSFIAEKTVTSHDFQEPQLLLYASNLIETSLLMQVDDEDDIDIGGNEGVSVATNLDVVAESRHPK